VQHWIAANEDNVAVAIVPVDAPLVTLGDVIRGTWPREFGQRRGDIFSQVMNNYWYTNFALAQGGDFTFRYVVTSGTRLAPAYLGRFGREEMSPLEVDQISSQDKSGNPVRPLEGVEGSFLKVNDPDLVLVTWKHAEDQKGTVLRFLEMAGKPAKVHVAIPLLDVKSAWMADAMERNKDALDVTAHGFIFPAKPFQIVTIRVEGTSAIQRTPSTP
jgi:alpha-mannosidase